MFQILCLPIRLYVTLFPIIIVHKSNSQQRKKKTIIFGSHKHSLSFLENFKAHLVLFRSEINSYLHDIATKILTIINNQFIFRCLFIEQKHLTVTQYK